MLMQQSVLICRGCVGEGEREGSISRTLILNLAWDFLFKCPLQGIEWVANEAQNIIAKNLLESPQILEMV